MSTSTLATVIRGRITEPEHRNAGKVAHLVRVQSTEAGSDGKLHACWTDVDDAELYLPENVTILEVLYSPKEN